MMCGKREAMQDDATCVAMAPADYHGPRCKDVQDNNFF